MAITTFSGPIRSLAGFIPAGFAASNDLNANNTTVLLRVFPTPSVDAAGNPNGGTLVGHAGKINLYTTPNAAGVGTLTLPPVISTVPSDSTDPNQQCNIGAVIEIIIAVNLANALVINCSGTDGFTGYAQVADVNGLTTTFDAAGADDILTFNNGTQGGAIDTKIKATAVDAGLWYIEAISIGADANAAATPFSQ